MQTLSTSKSNTTSYETLLKKNLPTSFVFALYLTSQTSSPNRFCVSTSNVFITCWVSTLCDTTPVCEEECRVSGGDAQGGACPCTLHTHHVWPHTGLYTTSLYYSDFSYFHIFIFYFFIFYLFRYYSTDVKKEYWSA